MICKKCKTDLPENANFCNNCGEPVPKQGGMTIDQKMGTLKGDAVGLIAANSEEITGIDASIKMDIGTVESNGTAVGAVVGGKQGNIHLGGEQKYGDQVNGDKITLSDIQGETVTIAAGSHSQATTTIGENAEAIKELFMLVYQQIQNRPADPNADKEEIVQTVQMIEAEAAKGEEANPKKIERRLQNLASMAPDILKVTAATLINPAAGVATAIRLIAEKAKSENIPTG